MNDELKTVRDDLAFLRTIAEGGGDRGGIGAAGGALYGCAGVLYGIQTLVYFAQEKGAVSLGFMGNMVLAWLPTVIFVVLMTIVIIIDRRRPQVGFANRAINAAFGGAGLANLALVVVFGMAAARHRDFHYWLYHPAVVFVLQGAVWYVVFVLRKRIWMLLVSLGWLASGIALGLLVEQAWLYLLVASGALFGFMGVPGFHMMRQALQRDA